VEPWRPRAEKPPLPSTSCLHNHSAFYQFKRSHHEHHQAPTAIAFAPPRPISLRYAWIVSCWLASLSIIKTPRR
jgi:hypothetical protein